MQTGIENSTVVTEQTVAKEEETFMKSLEPVFLSVLLACPLPAQQTAPSTQTAHPAQKTISRQIGTTRVSCQEPEWGTANRQTSSVATTGQRQDTAFDPLAALTAAQSTKSTSTAAGAPPSGPPPAAGAAMGAASGAALGAIAGDCGQRRSYLEEANARQLVSAPGNMSPMVNTLP